MDDPTAIREALELGDEVPIPNVRRTNDPKSVLHELISQSRHRRKRIMDVLSDIALCSNRRRCLFPGHTGFAFLVEDVCREFDAFFPKP